MTYCLDFDTVVEINRRHTNGNGIVVDPNVVKGALGRPMHGFGGMEFYPTIIAKAAVLLEALARTQGFVDGNKRTAWLSCVTFLGLHGLLLRDEADAYAADMVLMVVGGELNLEQIQEWILDNLED